MIISSVIRRRCLAIILIISLIFLGCCLLHIRNPSYDIDDDRTRELLLLAEKYSFCSTRSVRRGL